MPLVPGALEIADPAEAGALWPLDWEVGGCAGRWPAGVFARPGPAGPEGVVPLVPGALEVADPAADGAFWPLDWAVGGCAGRWPAGVFARPGPDGPDGAGPGALDAGGVFWLPWMGGCEGRCAAGVFARPGPAGPEGAVPGVLGALEVADPAAGGALWPLDWEVGGCAGRWPAGVFARPGPDGLDGAVPGVPDAGGVFWLPWTGGRVGRWPAPGPAGPEGAVLLIPGADAGGVFWPLDCAADGCADRWPAAEVWEAGAFGLPVPLGAAPGVPPAGLGAEPGDGAFDSAAGPEAGPPLALVPPGAGAFDPAAEEFEGAGREAEPVRLSGVGGFAPPDGPGCCVEPAPRAGPPAAAEVLEVVADDGASAPAAGPFAGFPPGVFEAGAGEFGVLAGLFAGFAPAVFDVASVFLDEAGPLPGLAGACPGSPARGALGAGPRLPVSAPEGDRSVPDGEAFGRCPLAMRSVGAADASGLRSAAAPGRASAPAASAGSALSRAGFFSSFGSDTHTPRQSGTV
ncbi:hypothetical protein [Nocardia gamkensis]|uniref:hypothetical protein n=1 Tax=Nocardia gamkensis TaxID=352869 RepID=UPI001576CB76|nr:hypothetical protein [Nocardia gamkensis]